MNDKIIRLTPTERRILAILSDGKPHPRQELQGCLNDDLATPQVVRQHISNLRTKIDSGQEIISTFHNKKMCYRLIKS
jgi:DNA-binding response OmpR family regulator